MKGKSETIHLTSERGPHMRNLRTEPKQQENLRSITNRKGDRKMTGNGWKTGIIAIASIALFGVFHAGTAATGDFNGDGYEDLAIGVPYEDCGDIVDAGMVNVIYGTSAGLDSAGSQSFTQSSPGIDGGNEEYDRFGYALAVGNFNGDDYSDLAIGIPDESVGTLVSAGRVVVIYGSADGLDSENNFDFNQNTPMIEEVAEAYDMFGYALTAGDFDGNGCDDLAVGVPGEEIDGILFAGAVNVLYGFSYGLSIGGDQLWHQDVSGIADSAEPYDYYGIVLAAGDFAGDGYDDLCVGIPYEDINGESNAGAVNVIYGSSGGLTARDQIFHQDMYGVDDTAEGGDNFGLSLATGDFDGDGRDDLAVGVPYETYDSLILTGIVHVLYGGLNHLGTTGSQIWNQDSPGIRGTARDADTFGFSVASGDFNDDGYDDLAVGVPGEEVNGMGDAGAVNILFGSSGSGLTDTKNRYGHQDSPGMLDEAEWYDYFGVSLAAGDFNGNGFDDLVIGIPYEDIHGVGNAGAVQVVYTYPSGNQFWHQGNLGISTGIEQADNFGVKLGTGSDF